MSDEKKCGVCGMAISSCACSFRGKVVETGDAVTRTATEKAAFVPPLEESFSFALEEPPVKTSEANAEALEEAVKKDEARTPVRRGKPMKRSRSSRKG